MSLQNFTNFLHKAINADISNVMKKLCVIFGGNSCEHDISVITGMQLASNVKDVEKIYYSRDNKFFLASKIQETNCFAIGNQNKLKEVIFYDGAVWQKGLTLKKLFDVECAINCCHGGFGEGGELSAFFHVNNIKTTSSNSLSCHIAMDKDLCKTLLKGVVPTIKGAKVTKQNFDKTTKQIEKSFSNNLIVKPNSLGSSIGVKPCDKQDFKHQIQAIFELNDDALVEERVEEILEYNQACYRTHEGLALSCIEHPLSKHEFLTFEDKYCSGKTKGKDRVIPAQISSELEEEIIEATSRIYEKLNMNGVVRIDYIYDNKAKKLYFNEINTIPGSMAFYLFEPIGIDYISLIDDVVANSIEPKKFKNINTDILSSRDEKK